MSSNQTYNTLTESTYESTYDIDPIRDADNPNYTAEEEYVDLDSEEHDRFLLVLEQDD